MHCNLCITNSIMVLLLYDVKYDLFSFHGTISISSKMIFNNDAILTGNSKNQNWKTNLLSIHLFKRVIIYDVILFSSMT